MGLSGHRMLHLRQEALLGTKLYQERLGPVRATMYVIVSAACCSAFPRISGWLWAMHYSKRQALNRMGWLTGLMAVMLEVVISAVVPCMLCMAIRELCIHNVHNGL